MIVRLELIFSIENTPPNMQDNLRLKEGVCERLKGFTINVGGKPSMTITDVGVYGSGLSSECEK